MNEKEKKQSMFEQVIKHIEQKNSFKIPRQTVMMEIIEDTFRETARLIFEKIDEIQDETITTKEYDDYSSELTSDDVENYLILLEKIQQDCKLIHRSEPKRG